MTGELPVVTLVEKLSLARWWGIYTGNAAREFKDRKLLLLRLVSEEYRYRVTIKRTGKIGRTQMHSPFFFV